jgi:hypothetical protein
MEFYEKLTSIANVENYRKNWIQAQLYCQVTKLYINNFEAFLIKNQGVFENLKLQVVMLMLYLNAYIKY